MCPHTTTCVLILLYVSSCYYVSPYYLLYVSSGRRCHIPGIRHRGPAAGYAGRQAIHHYMCPHTTIYVSSYYLYYLSVRRFTTVHYMCVLVLLDVLILLCMCPRTTIYVSPYYCMCVLVLLCVIPGTSMYISSYYLMCVLMPLYVPSCYCICLHTIIFASLYYYRCVLVLLYMCPHATLFLSSYVYLGGGTCSSMRTAIYVSS